MKVALDISRIHNFSKGRGIGTYAYNLSDALKKFTQVDVKLIEEKESLSNFDLVHYPYFDFFQHTLPLNKIKPTVVTIHDVIPIQFPQHYPPGIKGKINFQLQKVALNNVKAIIAVSQTVKKDIGNVLKIIPGKIFPVYSGVSKDFHKISDKKLLLGLKDKLNLPDKFCLYVGNVNWNKNISNITQACIEANKNLVIIGGSFLDKSNLDHPEKKSFKQFLEKYADNEKIKILGKVEKNDLVALYNLAECLVFASYYEGFGLPILEAQACGLPVITSKVSATSEIAGDGAILVNPDDYKEIATAINKIYSSRNFSEKLIVAGFINTKRFSWEKTAQETIKVYENILK